MDSTVVIFIFAVIIVGALVFLAIILTGHRAHVFNKDEYQTDFLVIENALDRDNPLSYDITIVNADKLLDKALSEMGVPGNTMGDRLKKSADSFTAINSVWYVHKLRNQIAHEHGFHVEYKQAVHALLVYKQALKDLGAI